eukprot:scaffold4576_cov88-Skeletonema_dohrnii-CCMP3373.AAC.4
MKAQFIFSPRIIDFDGIAILIRIKLEVHRPIMGVYCTTKDDNNLFLLSIDANAVDYVIL